MRLSDFLKHQEKDKIEITKQQQAEIQKVFDNRILPQRNHTLFEYNLIDKTIEVATFDSSPEIKWEDAVKGLISTNRKITRKDNCIYISALNKVNVIKILRRDFDIRISDDLTKPNKMESIKKCMICRYDNSITEPPYLTIQIDEIKVLQPQEDNYGEVFAERLRVGCQNKGYQFKFYTMSENKDYDYEIVVY
jgi:hypothetical protein